MMVEETRQVVEEAAWIVPEGEVDEDEEGASMERSRPLLKRHRTLSSTPLAMINENDLFKQDWRSRSEGQVLQYVLSKQTLAFLVGILTGIIASLIKLVVENITGYKLLAVVRFIEQDRYMARFLLFAGSNFLLMLPAAVLCVGFALTAAGRVYQKSKFILMVWILLISLALLR